MKIGFILMALNEVISKISNDSESKRSIEGVTQSLYAITNSIYDTVVGTCLIKPCKGDYFTLDHYS